MKLEPGVGSEQLVLNVDMASVHCCHVESSRTLLFEQKDV